MQASDAVSFSISNHFKFFSRRVGTPRAHSLLLYQSNDKQTDEARSVGKHEMTMHCLPQRETL